MELKISNVKKTFRGIDGEPDFMLQIPDLVFRLGEATFIMGPNGSGKSVFLRLLAGDLLPDNAAVTLTSHGKCWKAQDHRAGIVRQRAEDNLALDLTVRENLKIRKHDGLLLNRIFPNRSSHHFEALLKQHSVLLQKLDQPCRNLSAGQRQTLSFVVAAAENNTLLALDEFLSATDQETSTILRGMMKAYAKDKMACVLVVSHDIRTALKDAERILVLKDGRLFSDFTQNSENWNEGKLSMLLA